MWEIAEMQIQWEQEWWMSPDWEFLWFPDEDQMDPIDVIEMEKAWYCSWCIKTKESCNCDDIQFATKMIAMAVRNKIEDFHVEHLTDDQMKQLNPLIRQGIYQALVVIEQNCEWNNMATKMMQWLEMMIPEYWEDSQLDPQEAQILLSEYIQ